MNCGFKLLRHLSRALALFLRVIFKTAGAVEAVRIAMNIAMRAIEPYPGKSSFSCRVALPTTGAL